MSLEEPNIFSNTLYEVPEALDDTQSAADFQVYEIVSSVHSDDNDNVHYITETDDNTTPRTFEDGLICHTTIYNNDNQYNTPVDTSSASSSHFQQPETCNVDITPKEEESNKSETKKKKRTRIPVGDMLSIMLSFLIEGFSYTFPGPFLGNMIVDFGLVSSTDKAGYYAGMVSASFSISQFFTGFIYGVLADKISKKLVILISTFGCFLMVLLFGFAPTFPVALIARIVHGGLNGNVATIKAHLSDITDESNQALGFSLLGLSWALGAIGGPIIGGYLAQPAEKYKLKSKVFKKFPYALPCIFVAGLLAIGFFIALAFMKYSSPKQLKKKKEKEQKDELSLEEARRRQLGVSDSLYFNPDTSTENSPATDSDLSDMGGPVAMHRLILERSYRRHLAERPATPSRIQIHPADSQTNVSSTDSTNSYDARRLFMRHMQSQRPQTDQEKDKTSRMTRIYQQLKEELREYLRVIFKFEVIVTVTLFFLCSTIDTLHEDLFPLWAIIDKKKGGISFNTSQIGTVHLIIGALMVLEPLVFPLMAKLLGSLWTLRIAFVCIIPLACVPQIYYTSKYKASLWVSLVIYSIIRAFTCSLTFTAVYILINNSAPSNASGRVMSFSNSAGCIAKVIAPLTAGPLLAGCSQLSQKKNTRFFLNIPFLLCSLGSAFAIALTFLLNKSINHPPPTPNNQKPEEDPAEKSDKTSVYLQKNNWINDQDTDADEHSNVPSAFISHENSEAHPEMNSDDSTPAIENRSDEEVSPN